MMWVRLLFPVTKYTSGGNLQNSNVFLQLFSVHKLYILKMFLVFNDL